jgi:IMP dehydrogenase
VATVTDEESESLREYLILPGWIECKPEEVSLETKLGKNISLQYPYMTARMQCVVGPKLSQVAGRNGILTCVPRSLRDSDKQLIIDANKASRLKKGEIETTDKPEYARPDYTLDQVVARAKRTGHSVIPILDQYFKLQGIFFYDPNKMPQVAPSTMISAVMTPLRSEQHPDGLPYLIDGDSTPLQEFLKDKRVVPVLRPDNTLVKLAFPQKFDTNYIGIAIGTRNDWDAEMDKWAQQVDTMMIDSSNACFPDALNILRRAKERYPDMPFGIGNIVRGSDFKIFAEAGADYVIGGMGVGSICQTGAKRGNGRGQFTVAKDLAHARDDYAEHNGRYVPVVIDGGIASTKDMTVALAFADLLMMGNYFNRFYEAAGEKFDSDGNPTLDENLTRRIETWGEGHPRARLVGMYGMKFQKAAQKETNATDQDNLDHVIERYGHSSLSSATVEGVVGTVECRGRLKPCVEEDARYIRTTMANSGARNLEEFRKKAVLEHASKETTRDMYPHDINEKKE